MRLLRRLRYRLPYLLRRLFRARYKGDVKARCDDVPLRVEKVWLGKWGLHVRACGLEPVRGEAQVWIGDGRWRSAGVVALDPGDIVEFHIPMETRRREP